MINYSIVMRPVNSNLFEINAAKGRIKAAQAAGETPNAADVALVATEKQNAFATAQYADVMTIEKFARHIATHGCVYSRADISAILYMAVDCMREQLLEGKKIRLGDLGDFSVSLSSKGAETADKFSAANITEVKVLWDAGSEFKNLKKDAEFNLVASRSAQAALLKAVKSGGDTPSGGGDTPSGGGGSNPAADQNTISITSIGGVANGGELTMRPATTYTVVGTKLTDLDSDMFQNSAGKELTFTATSDTEGTLAVPFGQELGSTPSTLDVYAYDRVIFTLNVKGS